MLNNPLKFVIWFKGFLDACDGELNKTQTRKVAEILDTVFVHPEQEPKKHLADMLKGTGIPVYDGFPVPSNEYTGPNGGFQEGVKMRC